MQGRRIYPDMADGGAMFFAEGDYGRNIFGRWIGKPPGGRLGQLGEVIEHEDGTVSAADICIGNAVKQWRGVIERGVWKVLKPARGKQP